MSSPSSNFRSSLSLFDGVMLVAGSMIGSGIFIVSADMVRNTGGAGWLILIWFVTGLVTLTAALSYGELSSMFPKAGGQYVYLKEAFNPLVSFVYGWSLFMVIQTATIAAVGVAFAKFSAYLIPFFSEDNHLMQLGDFSVTAAQLLAIFTIILLTYINTLGVNGGKKIQSIFTVAKIASMACLIIFGFLFLDTDIWKQNWNSPTTWTIHSLANDGTWQTYAQMGAIGAIVAAMVGSIFSSDAWNNVTFIAGEIKNPQRNVGLSLALGTLIVTVVYMLINIMYTGQLSMQEIAYATKDRVAVDVSSKIFGDFGTSVIAIMIMIATFGCNNGLILAGARVFYSMANDGLFFKNVAKLNKNSVPEVGLWMQCLVASLWCISGKYGDLLDMISFVVVFFYMLTIVGIFVLRKNKPDLARPYKAFGYPFLPGLYILFGIVFCVALIIYKPTYTWIGMIIALLGVPIYYLLKRNISSKI